MWEGNKRRGQIELPLPAFGGFGAALNSNRLPRVAPECEDAAFVARTIAKRAIGKSSYDAEGRDNTTTMGFKLP